MTTQDEGYCHPHGSNQEVVSTFSLVAHDSSSGDLGVVVASRFLAVGAHVPYAWAGVGAVATQAFANPTFGPRALEILKRGGSPQDCQDDFIDSDGEIAKRQFGIVAANGKSLSYTGQQCLPWSGGRFGDHYAAQGNILTAPSVLDALVETYVSHPDVAFPERLVGALQAADAEGGDRRGRQAAALLVVGKGKGLAGLTDRWIDLRVDDATQPVQALQRLLEIFRLQRNRSSYELRQLSRDEILWLQQLLNELGDKSVEPSGKWNHETSTGLSRLLDAMGLTGVWHENEWIEPVAWEYLKQKVSFAQYRPSP